MFLPELTGIGPSGFRFFGFRAIFLQSKDVDPAGGLCPLVTKASSPGSLLALGDSRV
jgi:hypothetical protein